VGVGLGLAPRGCDTGVGAQLRGRGWVGLGVGVGAVDTWDRSLAFCIQP